MSGARLRLAVWQCAAGGLSLDQRLDRLERALAAARQDGGPGPQLVLCPELFVSGYNVGDELPGRAEPAGGPTFERIAEIARRQSSAIVYGYPEREVDRRYNAAAFVGADGELLANHRKRLHSPGSFEQAVFSAGTGPTLLDYAGWRIALLICYEVEFPEAVRGAALDGAQLVLAPTALAAQWEVVASRVVPARAFENGVWLAYANHAGRENGLDYLGGSRIVAPDGAIEAEAGPGECLLGCHIDAARVAAAQDRLPYLRDCRRLSPTTFD